MDNHQVVLNKRFEHEKWLWNIQNKKYIIEKYRQIDCDEEPVDNYYSYYYDCIYLIFKNEQNEVLFSAKVYKDEMSFFGIKNSIEDELLDKLKEKYSILTFKFFDNKF